MHGREAEEHVERCTVDLALADRLAQLRDRERVLLAIAEDPPEQRRSARECRVIRANLLERADRLVGATRLEVDSARAQTLARLVEQVGLARAVAHERE